MSLLKKSESLTNLKVGRAECAGEVEYCGLGVAALSLSIDVVVVDEAGVVGAVGVVAEVQ